MWFLPVQLNAYTEQRVVTHCYNGLTAVRFIIEDSRDVMLVKEIILFISKNMQ